MSFDTNNIAGAGKVTFDHGLFGDLQFPAEGQEIVADLSTYENIVAEQPGRVVDRTAYVHFVSEQVDIPENLAFFLDVEAEGGQIAFDPAIDLDEIPEDIQIVVDDLRPGYDGTVTRDKSGSEGKRRQKQQQQQKRHGYSTEK
jgi:hypothetical protein